MTTSRNTTEITETETLGHIKFHLKSRKSMKYDISKSTAPTMPNLGKGTECIKILLKETQKACVNRLFRCFSPSLARVSASQNFIP